MLMSFQNTLRYISFNRCLYVCRLDYMWSDMNTVIITSNAALKEKYERIASLITCFGFYWIHFAGARIQEVIYIFIENEVQIRWERWRKSSGENRSRTKGQRSRKGVRDEKEDGEWGRKGRCEERKNKKH